MWGVGGGTREGREIAKLTTPVKRRTTIAEYLPNANHFLTQLVHLHTIHKGLRP